MTGPGTWIPGVPQPLPPGEALLWHGRPDRRALARHALHTRALSGYFGVIILLGLVGAVRDGVGAGQIVTTLTTQAALAGLVIALANGYAALVSRSTVYAVTERRVVLKIGLVVPTTINLPLRQVESASSRIFPDGTGEVALAIRPPDRIGYFHLWPHARAWRLRWPEPLLRGLTDTAAVTAALQRATALEGPASAEPAAPEPMLAVAR